MMAYHLVRALICLAPEQSGIAPRGYRFAKVAADPAGLRADAGQRGR